MEVDPTAKVNFSGLRYAQGSRFHIGPSSIVHASLIAERPGARILIGRNTTIGQSTIACATEIEIGDDVFISWSVTVFDHDSHPIAWSHRQQDVKDQGTTKKDWTHVAIAPVRIGNKAWIGMNAIILKGVEIGEGAIVAAGAVVTRTVPPWTITGGNPARVIREIPLEER